MAALAVRRLNGVHVAKPSLTVFCRKYSDGYEGLTEYRRGTGGRSSFSGLVCTVFGATGFLGRALCARLGQIGSQIVVPYRGDFYEARDLKLCGDLGQPYHLKDDNSIRKSLKYSNVVINCVGSAQDTKSFTIDQVHNKGAQRIAKIAKEAGVEKFIQISMMNASPKPQPILQDDGSQVLKSKYYGELAVRQEFPDATIIRPADIFGPGDNFFHYYARPFRRVFRHFMPFHKRGTQTYKQPVFVNDVTQGILNAIHDESATGQLYEFAGNERYRMYDMLRYFNEILRIQGDWSIIPTPPHWTLKMTMNEKLPNMHPLLTRDRYERESVSDVLTPGVPGLESLGIPETDSIINHAYSEINMYKKMPQEADTVKEFVRPLPPNTVPYHVV